MGIHIVRLQDPVDFEHMAELQDLSIRKLLQHDYSTQQIEALAATQDVRKQGSLQLILLAKDDIENQLVGFVAMVRGKPQIAGLYIHPRFVRQGVGSALLRTLMELAHELGYRSLYVVSSVTATPFYQANGFETIESLSWLYLRGQWIRCVLLKKALRTTPWIQTIAENFAFTFFSGIYTIQKFIIALVLVLLSLLS
jgi:N-acetylglutamate synthase-like GNAT family acetyltransferase